MLRAAQAIWPSAAVAWLGQLSDHCAGGPMYPLVLGPVAASVGLGPLEAALVAAQGSVSGPAWAATRLLGIDPYAVGSCLADLAPAVEQVAHDAGALTSSPSLADAIAELPSGAAVLVEIGAEAHAAWEVRLFAS